MGTSLSQLLAGVGPRPDTTSTAAPVTPANLGMGAQPGVATPPGAASLTSSYGNGAVLNGPGAVADSLHAMLARSYSGKNGSVRRENGGAIWHMPDQSHLFVAAAQGKSTTFDQSTISRVPPVPGAYIVATAHSHPYDFGFNEQAGGEVHPDAHGGGSVDDWGLADNPGYPVYTITPKYISRLDPDTKPGDREGNPNRWPTPKAKP